MEVSEWALPIPIKQSAWIGSNATVPCGLPFALTAAPDIVTNPTDIALVLDRSGSMTGTPLTNMKAGADTFIDIIAEATGGTADGQIGSGSHIGIVSFSSTATADTQLITSVATLKKRCQFVDCRRQHQPRRRVYQSDRAV